MANFDLKSRIYCGAGKGFWIGLQNDINIAIGVLTNNNNTGPDDTSSDEDTFDPAENTVNELLTGIATIIGTL